MPIALTNIVENPVMKNNEITIGGLIPITTIDFPGLLSAVIFCQGCTCRCDYCHNPHLLTIKPKTNIPWKDVRSFLLKRKHFLEGVVFSGGEPLLQKRLPEIINEVKEIGYKVALHTTGLFPSKFEKVISLLDWVGFDIKAPFRHYEKVTKLNNSGDKAKESLKLLLKSKIKYEVRTTFDPRLFDKDILLEIVNELSSYDVQNFTLQECRISNKPIYNKNLFDSNFLKKISKHFTNFNIKKI